MSVYVLGGDLVKASSVVQYLRTVFHKKQGAVNCKMFNAKQCH